MNITESTLLLKPCKKRSLLSGVFQKPLKMTHALCTFTLFILLISPSLATAAVTTLESQKLGTLLTPMGAEKSGNKDRTIPGWTGKLTGFRFGEHNWHTGMPTPDIYKHENSIYTVTAQNLKKHSAFISDGIKALFIKYPETFFMPVYPSHRDGRFSSKVEKRTAWNATHTLLSKDGNNILNYTGGAPFPIPKNGTEVIWNARITHPNSTIIGFLDDVAVYSNGKRHLSRQKFIAEFPYANPENIIGETERQIGNNAGLLKVTVFQPEVDKGRTTVVHETVNPKKSNRKSWIYSTERRHVRRSPNFGYNLPYGPGGLITADDILGFNGEIDRYNWALLGKKEMLIPYHNYHFDETQKNYFPILMEHHANPEFMRYEKHRVWIVEANLKKQYRHSYSKRRFYIDEDSWQIVLLESYDQNGELWKVGILNTIYDFSVQGYIARAQFFHDLKQNAYLAARLVNIKGQPELTGNYLGEAYYSPNNLRKRREQE